jgi:hypothetical protein
LHPSDAPAESAEGGYGFRISDTGLQLSANLRPLSNYLTRFRQAFNRTFNVFVDIEGFGQPCYLENLVYLRVYIAEL